MPINQYELIFSVQYRVTAHVEAESEEDARAKAAYVAPSEAEDYDEEREAFNVEVELLEEDIYGDDDDSEDEAESEDISALIGVIRSRLSELEERLAGRSE